MVCYKARLGLQNANSTSVLKCEFLIGGSS